MRKSQVYTGGRHGVRPVNIQLLMEALILFLQCLALYVMTTIASTLENSQRSRKNDCGARQAITHKDWVVHVVHDTDAESTPSVVVTQSGQLVLLDSDLHAALVRASVTQDTLSLLAGDSLYDVDSSEGPIVSMRYSRTVHHGTRREEMQQVVEDYKCDLVPVHEDAPPPSLVLHDAHAVLGILLAREHAIPSSPEPCDNRHPKPQSPRKTPQRGTARGEASTCATSPTTS